MLAIRVETEKHGEEYARVSAERLGDLVLRIGADGDRFLVVQRIPDVPDVFVQVWHADGGGYQLEHRDGAPERHFMVELADAGRVAEAMVRWARQESAWDAGLPWEPVRLPLPEPVPEPAAEIREQVEEHVRELLVCGYANRARLAEAAEEWLVSGDERPVSPAQARQLVDRLWRERLEEQAGWVGTTDPERVARAFAALDARGIVAREDFTCCRTCGMSEIGEEGDASSRGFVFFHSQCTAGAAAGHGLYLLYGGFDGSEETTAAIGREVVAALGEEGLTVDWDGSPEQAIIVTGLDWRKRLP
ncbi:hypothetical protein AMK26_04260 [Streptomyces sp. CB03234]|uniref:DUF6891 domain-containing protein n=1 Tax=Streptomyces sp. (strain CB03234) TaxID=1703937 RepID=UPI000939F6E9|nr:hypothetical protein [Streptomyces sp. CB03234]OKK08236.1 hypothetical protein AMK26_04260 [Streptomyces sp. CB03234]